MGEWIAEHTADMLDDIGEYVGIETPSADLDALRRGREWVAAWVADRLGPASSATTHDGGAHGDTVVLDHVADRVSGVTVAMLAHYDTVWPIGTLAAIPFSVDGDTIRGPGVFDMKAGLVQAVWAVRALAELGLPRPALRLVLNGDEEIGSLSSRPVIEAACRDATEVLVFEAHAGLDPTAGASAITALAALVDHVHGLTDLETGTTANVGLVRGGTGRNVTAGQATAGIDVRVADAAESDRVERALRGWRPADARVQVRVDGGWNRPAMARSAGTAALYERARVLAAGLGFDLREVSVGGASDGNFAAALGRPVLDGLGAVGDGAHARSEHATVSGMVERATLTAALLTSRG